MASTRRKAAAIAIAFIGVAGLSLAAAAQLTVDSTKLAAGSVSVTGCDTAVSVDYTTGFADGVYGVTAVTVSDINVTDVTGCVGEKLDVTLFDVNGESLGTASVASISTASHTFDLEASAADTVGVAVVIH